MYIHKEKLRPEEIADYGIRTWPIWEKEESEFNWNYETKERCLLLQGEATVKTEFGQLELKAGDYVEFPKGLKTHWVVRKPVRKHYKLI